MMAPMKHILSGIPEKGGQSVNSSDYGRLRRRGEGGQALITFVFSLAVLILMMGWGIDLGFAYITQAQLSKGVDAACLAGMLNYPDGTSPASNMAANAFYANYRQSGRDTVTVVPSITFTTDSSQNHYINVNATATINTFFIRIMPVFGAGFPGWKTLTVASQAQAIRTKLYMMMVLDSSSSMLCSPGPGKDCSGGSQFLAEAVTNFLSNFSDTIDEVGADDFNTIATLDVPIQQPFKSLVDNAAINMNYGGWTDAQAGLQTALDQFNALSIPSGQVCLKVLVFFTDGFANTAIKQLDCSGTPLLMSQSDPIASTTGPWSISFENPSDGSGASCGSTSFLSIDGNTLTIDPANNNVWEEAELEALAMGNTIRSNNIVIFTVGLGTSSPPIINSTFLEELANANVPSNQKYDPNMPVGEAELVPTPDQLHQAFQNIANRILVRLTE